MQKAAILMLEILCTTLRKAVATHTDLTQISLCPTGLIQFMLNNSKERKKKKAHSEYETTQLILSHTFTRLNNKSRHSVYCQDASSKRLQDYSTQITPPLVQNSNEKHHSKHGNRETQARTVFVALPTDKHTRMKTTS